jgi:hypothetical protein
MKAWWRRRATGWMSERAPVLIVVAVVLFLFSIFNEADLGTKLRAGTLVFAFALAASFIRVPQDVKPRVRSNALREAAAKALREVPARARINPDRPWLAVEPRGVRQLPLIYLVEIVREEDGSELILLLPDPSLYRFLRRPGVAVFADMAHLRQDFDRRNMGVLPQGEFSDKLGVELFGADWRSNGTD